MTGESQNHGPIDHVVDHGTLDFRWGEVNLPVVHLGVVDIQITRFMVMELVAAILLMVILIPLARHVAKRPITRGPLMNAFEAMLLYMRDGVARPAIGGHAADAFLPYLWTVFFFVLFCNVLGMIPGGASATGNINVTGVLALMTFGTVLFAGFKAMGPIGFWIGIVPTLDIDNKFIKLPLWGLMFMIEVVGLLIKHLVLAVRLFANMLAGHIVLAVILGFIITVGGTARFVVMPASILGAVALSLLELFVAFLQAYIFTFLSALFIGSAVHPH